MEKKIISVRNLKKSFFIKDKIIKAVDDVSFDIYRGKTFAIVGESGCGKSTIANILSQLIKPTSGEIYFENKALCSKDLYLKKNIQFIFQDPYLSLNPKMRVKDIILEPIKIHKKYPKNKLLEIAQNLLTKVKLPTNIMGRFPHEFSGGQRQRIAIARAIALNPKFIICDEPLSSLDVSISSQIINLLTKLQKTLILSYLLISHNLAVVKHISDDIAVMYLGHFLEKSSTKNLFATPYHPYTQALISSSYSSKTPVSFTLKNETPSLINLPKGCLFSTRCPYEKKICFEKKPKLKEITEKHFVACHLVKATSNS